MIVTAVKIQGNGYRATIDGIEWSNITSGSSFYQEIEAWISAGNTPEPEFSAEEIEDRRVSDIKDKADAYILSKYSELSQRKLLSIGLKLLTKKTIKNLALTESELAELARLEEIDAWITSVRDVENSAQADGTSPEEIVWPTLM